MRGPRRVTVVPTSAQHRFSAFPLRQLQFPIKPADLKKLIERLRTANVWRETRTTLKYTVAWLDLRLSILKPIFTNPK